MGCIHSHDHSRVPPTPPTPPTLPVKCDLTLCTYDNTQPFCPSFTEGKCVKVYDGDTVHIASQIGSQVYRFSIRMYGYDSPELRTKNPDEKKAALEAKSVLEERILNKIVRIEVQPIREKYGRILAKLYDQNGEINTWMIENGYGKPYFGGTKEEF